MPRLLSLAVEGRLPVPVRRNPMRETNYLARSPNSGPGLERESSSAGRAKVFLPE